MLAYVEQEFDDYLECDRLEDGFMRVRCDRCHAEHRMPSNGKYRGFCPNCGARRMGESAALLVDEVVSEQPVCHALPRWHDPCHLRTLDFIARLAAQVPKPRVKLTRFHGGLRRTANTARG